MAQTVKVLGQAAPSATTVTTLYTATAVTAVCSTLTVCNRSSSAATFRVSVNVGGGSITNKDYIYYDLTVAGNDTFAATMGITLGTGDTVKVYASSANLSFNLFGVENS